MYSKKIISAKDISEEDKKRFLSHTSACKDGCVVWTASKGKRYIVRVKKNNVSHYGGTFDNVKEAEKAAINLRKELMPNSLQDR